jgi:hypothetical protein
LTLKFEEWLVAQQERRDLVGELARVPGMYNGAEPVLKRKSDEHKIWAHIVIKIASPGHVAVFNEAWQEFLLAKEATKESLD